MVGAAFNNPPISAPGAVNTRAWRGAEIPAANGHGTARALARIYGALARGGELDGVRILEPETIERARNEQVSGPDATLGRMPMRYGLGFMLRSDFMPLSPNAGTFGHPGAGGSIGMADPGRAGGIRIRDEQDGAWGSSAGDGLRRAEGLLRGALMTTHSHQAIPADHDARGAKTPRERRRLERFL